MNHIFLLGNLVDDVKVFTNKDGVKIVKGVVGIARDYTKKKESDYISFTVIGNSVDYVEKYGKKGTKTLIQGSWNHSTYKDKDGMLRSSDVCLVDDIKLFTETRAKSTKQSKDIPDDDLPF